MIFAPFCEFCLMKQLSFSEDNLISCMCNLFKKCAFDYILLERQCSFDYILLSSLYFTRFWEKNSFKKTVRPAPHSAGDRSKMATRLTNPHSFHTSSRVFKYSGFSYSVSCITFNLGECKWPYLTREYFIILIHYGHTSWSDL